MTIKIDALLALKEYIERKGIPTDRYIDLSGEDEFCPAGFLLAKGGLNTYQLIQLADKTIFHIYDTTNVPAHKIAVDTFTSMGFARTELIDLDALEHEEDAVGSVLNWIKFKLTYLEGGTTDEHPQPA